MYSMFSTCHKISGETTEDDEYNEDECPWLVTTDVLGHIKIGVGLKKPSEYQEYTLRHFSILGHPPSAALVLQAATTTRHSVLCIVPVDKSVFLLKCDS